MAEVLRSFDEPIRHSSGVFRARVVGRAAEDGMWEGWLEFVPLETAGGSPVISGVESRQTAREHLMYWAEGLTVVYAEGALDRALHPITIRARVAETPASEKPAARVVVAPAAPAGPEPVLDPFDIGRRSLDILRQQLHALNRERLFNIIAAYELNPRGADLTALTDAQLIAFIVAAVETQLAQRVR